MLDYDDLLLYWFHLMGDAGAGRAGGRRSSTTCWSTSTRTPTRCRRRSSRRLKPDGRGVTVVGDDAQAIYSFRAATRPQHPRRSRSSSIRPRRCARSSRTTARPSRSSAPPTPSSRWRRERHAKELFSAARPAAQRPRLVTVADELAQVDYVVERILERREAGRAAAPAGGAVPRRPPQRRAGGRARPPQHPLREVRRPALPRGRARQGRPGLPALGREPARRPGRLPGGAAAARDGAAAAPSGCATQVARPASRFGAPLAAWTPPAAARADWPAFVELYRAPVRRRHALGRAAGPGAPLVPAAPRAALRRRPGAPGRSRAAGAAGGGRALARALPLRPGPRSPRGHRRRGRPAPPGRGLPDPVHHPLGQGPGVGHASSSSTSPTAASPPTWPPATPSRSRRSGACSTWP